MSTSDPITNEKLQWIDRPDLISTQGKISIEQWRKLINE